MKPLPTTAVPRLFRVSIESREALQSSWMPMIKGGGLFIPTPADIHRPGDPVLLMLRLPGEKSFRAVAGKVVWIMPAEPLDRRRQGIGVQWLCADDDLRGRIETMLDGADAELTASYLF